VLDFFLVGFVLIVGNLLDSFEHFLLGSVYLVGWFVFCRIGLSAILVVRGLWLFTCRFRLYCFRRSVCVGLGSRLVMSGSSFLILHCLLFVFRGSLCQSLLRFQSVFLRVHHFTVFEFMIRFVACH